MDNLTHARFSSSANLRHLWTSFPPSTADRDTDGMPASRLASVGGDSGRDCVPDK